MLKYLALLLFAASAVAQPFPARPGPVIISQPSAGGSSSGGVDTNAVIALIEQYGGGGGGVVSNAILSTMDLSTQKTNGNDYLYITMPLKISVPNGTSAATASGAYLYTKVQGAGASTNISAAFVFGSPAGETNTMSVSGMIPPGYVWGITTGVGAGGSVVIDPLATSGNSSGIQLMYLSTNGGVSTAEVVAIMKTNSANKLITTNSRIFALGFEPIGSFAGYAPNVVLGDTNSIITGAESHSSFVIGGREGAGDQNIISNGLWCNINGGYGNYIIGDDESAGNSTIAGGELIKMIGRWTAGGYNSFNFIGGGEIHAMGNPDGSTFMVNSTIVGGRGNKITGTTGSHVFIGGGGADTGDNNSGHVVHNGDFSIIPGGYFNTISNAAAALFGWRLRSTNNYEVKIGYSNNAAVVASNGTLTAVAFAGNGNALSPLNADNVSVGTIPSAVFNGLYDQNVFLTHPDNVYFGSEFYTTDFSLLSHSTPIGNLPTGNDGNLWNSNKVLYWVTTTKTNLISDGR